MLTLEVLDDLHKIVPIIESVNIVLSSMARKEVTDGQETQSQEETEPNRESRAHAGVCPPNSA